MDSPQPGPPPFAEALRFWAWLGWVSFGGPAGQIAILHREVVERRRWVGDDTFLRGLNFCMLLPGPEALQLAIWLGWRLHGLRGGLAAGLCFILPAALLLLLLSFGYARYGGQPAVAAALLGLQATVVALVVHALLRLARRALGSAAPRLIALLALVAMAGLGLPFPLVVLAAALAGALWLHVPAGPAPALPVAGRPWRVLAAGLLLWLLPALAILAAAGGDSLYARIYGFFTVAAFVTFGGAYAVLAYVSQHAVEVQGWLSQAELVAGLGLAETTPGPLVIVLQFVGFMAGWNQPGAGGPAATALAGAALTAWATFLPSFVFILAAAPWVERLSARPRVGAALAGVTAAVVGVIANLALLFGAAVLFAGGEAQWLAIAITLAALAAFERTRLPLPLVIVAGAAAGWLAG